MIGYIGGVPFDLRSPRNLTLFFWCLAIALFAVQAWTTRFTMTWDGVQYLDGADQYLKRNWSAAVSSQWSPGYVWLIALMQCLLRPSPYWEFPAVHLVNFLLALVTLGAFQFFLNAMLRRLPSHRAAAVLILFPAFLYCTLEFTGLGTVTPDLLMHIFVYLVAGILIGIPKAKAPSFFLLGLLLGLGYLAKAPFFIYAFFVFALLPFLVGVRRPGYVRLTLGVAGFALIAGPYIAVLSHYKGRLTYGDSGQYNIVWMVNGVSYYHWQGDPPGSGVPAHPTRRISTDPPAFEFDGPIAGTYPPWYDPIYWNQGAKAHFAISEYLRVVLRSLRYYEYLVHHRQLALVFGLLILTILTPDWLELMIQLGKRLPVLAFGLMPFAMYAIVHADSRFLASFFVLVWSSLFLAAIEASAQIGGPSASRLIRTVALISGALMLVESCVVSLPTGELHESQDAVASPGIPHPHWEAARQLAALGVRPGDRVAIVGRKLPYFWARLARVRIVSEVLLEDAPYGRAGVELRTAEWLRVKDRLAATGAKVTVSPPIRGVVDQPGWTELGPTGIFAYKF